MKPIKLIPTAIALFLLGDCGQSGTSITKSKITSETTPKASETTAYTTERNSEEPTEQTAPTLLYMGLDEAAKCAGLDGMAIQGQTAQEFNSDTQQSVHDWLDGLGF